MKLLWYYLIVFPMYCSLFFFRFLSSDFISCILIISVTAVNCVLVARKKIDYTAQVILAVFNAIAFPAVVFEFNLSMELIPYLVVGGLFMLYLLGMILTFNPLLIFIFLMIFSLSSDLISLYVSVESNKVASTCFVGIANFMWINLQGTQKIVKKNIKSVKRKKSIDD